MSTPSQPSIPLNMPVSAVFITLNAVSQLEAALQSVSWCSEIVVVDSGSTDGTCELAARHGARVIEQAWMGFGPQKQFAVAQAHHHWVLCLDADERITPALQTAIQQALANPIAESVAGFQMPRCNYFLGRYLRHGEGYPDLSRRLFHRLRAHWSDDAVHEKVQANAVGMHFLTLQGDLLHNSAESLGRYLDKQNRYTTLQAQALAQRGKWPGLGKLVLSPWVRFIKFYVLRQGFRDGWPGLVHIAIGCFNSFMKYAKTRELMLSNATANKPK
ncbi:MAG TPA: glycosyltransferase family 2 protein [Limnobacter sp.]|nr:glycosyltransferase family 2 protein [Limnobacter sp.]